MPRPAGRGRHRDQRRHTAGEGGDRQRDRRGRGQGARREDRRDREGRLPRHRQTTRCQVVKLYGGGQYKLYTYRKYSDVRLVWAPEAQAAFFGGDPDNFNFPRYALDAASCAPTRMASRSRRRSTWKWTPRAPVDGEATFVVGNPGSTQRLFTMDQLAFQREVALPIIVTTSSELRGRLISEMEASPAKSREGADTLFGIENQPQGVHRPGQGAERPGFHRQAAAPEAALRQKSGGNPAIGDPWSETAESRCRLSRIYMAYRFLVPSRGDLFGYAHDAGPRRRGARQAQRRAAPGLFRHRAALAREARARRPSRSTRGSTS